MAGPEKCSPGNCLDGYCQVPGGAFEMGSTNGDDDEKPVRAIAMTGFQLGQTEVSVGQYRAFLVKNACAQLKAILSGCGISRTSITIAAKKDETERRLRRRASRFFSSHSCDTMQIVLATTNGMPALDANKSGDHYPFTGLRFDQKRAYCEAEGGDLATAAQLHFASRYDEEDSQSGQVVIRNNGFREVRPVKGGYQNRFGVYNLLGNVKESTLDAYDDQFYARMASHDPYNPMTDQRTQWEEFMGGSWLSDDRSYARPANRDASPSIGLGHGFRCARPLGSSKK